MYLLMLARVRCLYRAYGTGFLYWAIPKATGGSQQDLNVTGSAMGGSPGQHSPPQHQAAPACWGGCTGLNNCGGGGGGAVSSSNPTSEGEQPWFELSFNITAPSLDPRGGSCLPALGR